MPRTTTAHCSQRHLRVSYRPRHLEDRPLAKVVQDYARHFSDTTVEIETVEPTEDQLEQQGEIEDLMRFCSTQSFSRYREALVNEIDQCIPKPEDGTDVAAAHALKQAGLRRAIEMLDEMSFLLARSAE